MNIFKKITTVVVLLGACALIAPQQVVAMLNQNPQDEVEENKLIADKVMSGLGAITGIALTALEMDFFIKFMTLTYNCQPSEVVTCFQPINLILFWGTIGAVTMCFTLKLAADACQDGIFYHDGDARFGFLAPINNPGSNQ